MENIQYDLDKLDLNESSILVLSVPYLDEINSNELNTLLDAISDLTDHSIVVIPADLKMENKNIDDLILELEKIKSNNISEEDKESVDCTDLYN